MKFLKIFIFYFVISSNSSQAKSELPKEFGYVRMMTVQLSNNSLLGGNPIPEGWRDFMLVNYMKTESLHSASNFKVVNSFALVPHSPVIKENKEIPKEYSGKRLFLISRYQVYTDSLGQGRCIILIYPSTNESDKIISAAYFIPEATAQLILAQIPDFDPTEQPLAFDDNFMLENKNKFQGKHLESTILAIEEYNQAEAKSPNSKTLETPRDKDVVQKQLQKIQAAKDASFILKYLPMWCTLGVVLMLGITGWYFIHMNRAGKNLITP